LPARRRAFFLPTEWKHKAYRTPERQRWYEGETVSLGIGQGYNSFTILQLAHATATLANNGVVMKPHLVKEVENLVTRERRSTVPSERGSLDVRQEDIDVVKRGMVNVTTHPSGTAYKIFRDAPYVTASKTGTTQVFSLNGTKYHSHQLAEHLRDHALFIAFAPVERPQIAVALIVENGGWGSKTAGPIARRVLDFYLVERQNEGQKSTLRRERCAIGSLTLRVSCHLGLAQLLLILRRTLQANDHSIHKRTALEFHPARLEHLTAFGKQPLIQFAGSQKTTKFEQRGGVRYRLAAQMPK
jgi:hypothetical protein